VAVPSAPPIVDGEDDAAAVVVDDSFPLGGWEREKDAEGEVKSGLEATDFVVGGEEEAAPAAAAAAILALPWTRSSPIPSSRRRDEARPRGAADDRSLMVFSPGDVKKMGRDAGTVSARCLCLPRGR
jgi:hypothetical protein